MDPDILAALRASHFCDLPQASLEDLLDGAVRIKAPVGSVVHRQTEGGAYLELVIAGVIRVFVAAPDGRTMTIRYCRSGELLGAMSLFSNGQMLRRGGSARPASRSSGP